MAHLYDFSTTYNLFVLAYSYNYYLIDIKAVSYLSIKIYHLVDKRVKIHHRFLNHAIRIQLKFCWSYFYWIIILLYVGDINLTFKMLFLYYFSFFFDLYFDDIVTVSWVKV